MRTSLRVTMSLPSTMVLRMRIMDQFSVDIQPDDPAYGMGLNFSGTASNVETFDDETNTYDQDVLFSNSGLTYDQSTGGNTVLPSFDKTESFPVNFSTTVVSEDLGSVNEGIPIPGGKAYDQYLFPYYTGFADQDIDQGYDDFGFINATTDSVTRVPYGTYEFEQPRPLAKTMWIPKWNGSGTIVPSGTAEERFVTSDGNTVLFDFIGTTSPEKFIAQTPEDTVLLTFAGAATRRRIGHLHRSWNWNRILSLVLVSRVSDLSKSELEFFPSLVRQSRDPLWIHQKEHTSTYSVEPMFVLDLLLLRRQQRQLNVCMGNSITHRSTLLHIMVSTEISVSKLVLLSKVPGSSPGEYGNPGIVTSRFVPKYTGGPGVGTDGGSSLQRQAIGRTNAPIFTDGTIYILGVHTWCWNRRFSRNQFWKRDWSCREFHSWNNIWWSWSSYLQGYCSKSSNSGLWLLWRRQGSWCIWSYFDYSFSKESKSDLSKIMSVLELHTSLEHIPISLQHSEKLEQENSSSSLLYTKEEPSTMLVLVHLLHLEQQMSKYLPDSRQYSSIHSFWRGTKTCRPQGRHGWNDFHLQYRKDCYWNHAFYCSRYGRHVQSLLQWCRIYCYSFGYHYGFSSISKELPIPEKFRSTVTTEMIEILVHLELSRLLVNSPTHRSTSLLPRLDLEISLSLANPSSRSISKLSEKELFHYLVLQQRNSSVARAKIRFSSPSMGTEKLLSILYMVTTETTRILVHLVKATFSGIGDTRKITVYGYYGDDKDPGTSGTFTFSNTPLVHPEVDYTPHYTGRGVINFTGGVVKRTFPEVVGSGSLFGFGTKDERYARTTYVGIGVAGFFGCIYRDSCV